MTQTQTPPRNLSLFNADDLLRLMKETGAFTLPTAVYCPELKDLAENAEVTAYSMSEYHDPPYDAEWLSFHVSQGFLNINTFEGSASLKKLSGEEGSEAEVRELLQRYFVPFGLTFDPPQAVYSLFVDGKLTFQRNSKAEIESDFSFYESRALRGVRVMQHAAGDDPALVARGRLGVTLAVRLTREQLLAELGRPPFKEQQP